MWQCCKCVLQKILSSCILSIKLHCKNFDTEEEIVGWNVSQFKFLIDSQIDLQISLQFQLNWRTFQNSLKGTRSPSWLKFSQLEKKLFTVTASFIIYKICACIIGHCLTKFVFKFVENIVTLNSCNWFLSRLDQSFLQLCISNENILLKDCASLKKVCQ